MGFKPYPHQEEAIGKLKSGSILYGGVGSGKTLAALTFYKRYFYPKKLYVITTAKKRDSKDWELEASLLDTNPTIDSWNNIKKYKDIKDSFFIFDEQRVVGYSTWGKTFINIAKHNKWILLSATPGDTWMDYIPVFIANGFYKNKNEFIKMHVEYDHYAKYPKVKAYHKEGVLMRIRDSILVPMPMIRHTERSHQLIYSDYNIENYNKIMDDRWNPFTDKPIENPSELLHSLRKIVATDTDRIYNAKVLIDIHPRIIVFYNYNYELEILKQIANDLHRDLYQWNGRTHDKLPSSESWVYLVQYSAGAEGWNCIDTNVMLFYSLNYSYRIMEQAEGRIDRLNTPFKELEYYILTSKSKIDRDVHKAVITKKQFNATAWARKSGVIF